MRYSLGVLFAVVIATAPALAAVMRGAFTTAPPVVCSLTKNIVSDYSANGTGLVDVTTAFNNFGADALTWQASNTGTICLVTDNPPGTYFFGGTGAGSSWTAGIKTLSVSGVGSSMSDNIALTTNASTASGNSVLHFASVPAGVVIGQQICVVADCLIGSPAFFPAGTAITNISGGDVTLDHNASSTVASSTQVAVLGHGYFLGGGRFGANYNDNTHYINISTVAAGSNSITLNCTGKLAQCTTNLASCSTLLHNGDWALVTGLDMQGNGGFPQNPRWFEWVQISSINCVTGAITLASALQYSYDSTWPNYDQGSGGSIYQGGPATIYAIRQEWNVAQTYAGFNFNNRGAQLKAAGKTMTFQNCTFSNFGMAPTETLSLTETNCDSSATPQVEADKLWSSVLLQGGVSRGWLFQSAPASATFTLSNHHVTNILNGTPGNLVLTGGSQIDPGLNVGAIAYGNSISTNCDHSTISSGVVTGGFSDPIVANGATMSAGVITIPRSYEAPVPWAIPHTYAAWSCRFGPCGVFEVMSISADATNTYVQTDQAGGFPSYKYLGVETFTGIITLPGIVNFNTCSGSADATDLSQAAAQNKPLWSYSKRHYTGSNTSPVVAVWGKPTSIVITENTQYTGAGTPTFGLGVGGGDVFYSQTLPNIDATYGPVFDPKAALVHTVTITPTTVTGTSGSDSISAPGATAFLFANQQQPSFTATITGVDLSVEFTMDQGIQIPPP